MFEKLAPVSDCLATNGLHYGLRISWKASGIEQQKLACVASQVQSWGFGFCHILRGGESFGPCQLNLWFKGKCSKSHERATSLRQETPGKLGEQEMSKI